MMVLVANVVLIIVIATFRWPTRPSIIAFLACLTVAAGALMLDRTEQKISVQIEGVKFSVLAAMPLLMGAVQLASMRLRRMGYLSRAWWAFAWMVVVVAIGGCIARDVNHVWLLHAVIAFIGPLVVGLLAASVPPHVAAAALTRVEWTLVICAAAGLASVLGTALLGDVLDWNTEFFRVITPLGGPIATGAALLVVWPSILHRALSRSGLMWWIAATVTATCLLLTGSRAIIAAATLAMGLVLIVTMHTVRGKTRRTQLANGVTQAVAGLALLAVVFTLNVDRRAVRRVLERASLSDPPSLMGDVYRIESARTAATLIAEKPVVGHGAGQTYPWFRTEYSELESPITMIGSRVSLYEPHNMYLMIGVDYGMIVLASFVILLALTAFALGSGTENRYGRSSDYAVGLVAFAAQALGSSHLLVNERVAMAFWIPLGFAYALQGPHGERIPKSREHKLQRKIPEVTECN